MPGFKSRSRIEFFSLNSIIIIVFVIITNIKSVNKDEKARSCAIYFTLIHTVFSPKKRRQIYSFPINSIKNIYMEFRTFHLCTVGGTAGNR